MAQQRPGSFVPSEWSPGASGLLSDGDARSITVGNLFVDAINTGALNIRSVGRGMGVSPSYEPMYGNEYKYRGDTLAVQNKLFRLYLDVTDAEATSDIEFTLSTPSGNVLATYDDTINSSTITDALNDTEGFIATELAAFTPVTSITILGTYTGYIDIEFEAAPYFNYQFVFDITDGGTTSSVEVVQESIDPSMLGEWKLIGSNDKIGDCFQFWTTRYGLPRELGILNITNPASTTVHVQTVENHGLVENQSVEIRGVIGLPEVNGIWNITNVTIDAFDLELCVWVGAAYIEGGIVTTSIYGVGEIGVTVNDANGDITYTRLLRSNEFNFSTLHQIDCRVKRKQDDRIAIYFTESRGNQTVAEDSTNVPRVFYYKGAYVTDGAVLPPNIYEYGNISSELKLVLSNSDFSLEFFDQIQSGGSVKSGNWRYAARMVTADFSKTQFSIITDIVSTYNYDYQSAPLVIGDNPDVTTGKINVLKLTNNVIGLFKYVEIAAINYIGDLAIASYILGQYVLNQESVQYISHTGNESGLIDLDAGTIAEILPAFYKAQNVELLEDRLILSNLIPQGSVDFTPFVETFIYSLENTTLDPIGEWTNDATLLVAGEFQIPANIYTSRTHQFFETYRYGFVFRLKATGQLTQAYYPGYDIKIDLPTTLPAERVAGSFTSFDYTDGSAAAPTEVYSVYINWQNINLNYLIDGVPIYDLVDEIIPVRAPVTNPTVLLNGSAAKGVSGSSGLLSSQIWYGQTAAAPTPGAIGPYPFIAGEEASASNPTYAANPTYTQGTQGSGADGFTPEPDSIFIYAPDFSFNQTGLTFRSGDQIISFGAGFRHNLQNYLPASAEYRSYYAEFTGYSNITANPTPIDITEAQIMEFNGGITPENSASSATGIPPNTTIDGNPYNCTLLAGEPIGNALTYITDKCVACKLVSPLTNTGANTDYGFIRVIYYRPLDNPYGDPATTVYTEVCNPYKVNNQRIVIPAGDFITQGDCFVQKTYLKFRYPGWYDRATANINDGYGSGFGHYTQNRNNLQLRCKPNESWASSAVIQQLGQETWITSGYSTNASLPNMLYYPLFRDSQLFYNAGYTLRNGVNTFRSFDGNLDYQTDWGNAIAWSNIEVEGSNTDNLRTFPPLNLKFLDFTQGAITGAFNLNNNLFTIQPREVQRQFFNTTAMMTTLEGTEVILGSGAVLSNRGTTANKFGSSHKWSLIIGLSNKGHDVLYGIDDFNRIAWRLGYDGTVAMDELFGMKSFFANLLQWTKGKYTPAHDQGIRGVSNQRYKELIWTFRGRKEVEEWTDSDTTIQVIPFETGLGSELVTNPNLLGSLYGWISEDNTHTPDATVWEWNQGVATGSFAFTAPGNDGYLRQPIAFVVGQSYQIKVRSTVSSSSVNPIEISFQSGGSVEFSYTTSGDYYFTYIAQSGDDNIYFYYLSSVFPGQVAVAIYEVSIKEIISTPNWLGSPTWLIGNNEATANGTDADELIQDTADYIVSGASVILNYTLDNIGAGGVTAWVADQADTARTADGSYEFTTVPTTTGVIKFVPDNGFDGTVKGNLKLTTIVTRRYDLGDVVMVTPGDNFHLLPDFYRALVDDPVGLPTPFNEDWELIPHTDYNYYNEFTIVFSEIKNRFQSFASFLPLIYAKFQNTYLVPRPVTDTGRMYLADEGAPTTWFQEGVSVLTADAYFDATINQPSGRMRFLSLRIESDVEPTRIEVTTPTGTTFMTNADCVQREGNEFDCPVKADSTGTGINTANTSILWSDWGRFRFIIGATTYNKINRFIAKVRSRARTFYS